MNEYVASQFRRFGLKIGYYIATFLGWLENEMSALIGLAISENIVKIGSVACIETVKK